MSKVHKSDNAPVSPPSPNASIATTIADTTWRMFVPTIGLLLIGRAIDDTYATKPLGMAVGIVLGAIIAGILVVRQLNNK